MKTSDALVIDEPKTHEPTAQAVAEPAIESGPRATTGVKDAKIYIDGKFYAEAVLETIRQNHLRNGYIRLLVTRGIGNLGLNPTQCKYPSVIIIAATIALYHENFYRKGLTIVTCATRRSSPAALNPAVKSLN